MVHCKLPLVLIATLALAALLFGEEPKPATRPSATFQDVLRRVKDRDKDSGATLTVAPREDAPVQSVLQCAIRQESRVGIEVILTWPGMRPTVVEQYLLKPDEQLTRELELQNLFQKQKAEKH